jgi:tRNA G18 (ribose-2'-O)-methylase SpoU
MDKGINHGNILRIADAFRLESVTFSPVARRKQRDYSGAYAALRWVPFRWVEPLEAISGAREAGFRIYGMTLAEGAVAVRDVEWSHPAAIVLGKELEGLPSDVAAACDELVARPLYGMITSLNVAVCCALVVEACFQAYLAADPAFAPARGASAGLLLPPKTQTPPG